MTTNPNSEHEDMRYFPRWLVENRVSFQLHSDQTEFDGSTKDLSCSGMCLLTNALLPLNEPLKFSIFLDESLSIAVFGKAKWVKSDGQLSQFGIVFEDIPQEDQDLILDYAFAFNKEELLNHWFKGWNENPS